MRLGLKDKIYTLQSMKIITSAESPLKTFKANMRVSVNGDKRGCVFHREVL